jgi:hypothetical protein
LPCLRAKPPATRTIAAAFELKAALQPVELESAFISEILSEQNPENETAE